MQIDRITGKRNVDRQNHRKGKCRQIKSQEREMQIDRITGKIDVDRQNEVR